VRTLGTILAAFAIIAANFTLDYLIVTNPSQLRLRVERELSNFIGAKFSVEKVEFDSPAFLSIYGLKVFDTRADSTQEVILTIPRLRMRLDLVRQAIKHIIVDSPSLSVRVDKSGNLNLARLLKERAVRPPGEKLEKPEIQIIPEIEMVGGFISLDAALGERDLVRTELHTIGASVKVSDGAVILTGSAFSPVLGSIDFRATADSGLRSLNASIVVDRVVLSRELRDSLPGSLQSIWDEINPSGLVAVEGKLHYDKEELDYEATIECRDCAALLKSFPIPISLANGKIKVKKDLIAVQNFTYLVNGVYGKTEGVIEGNLRSPGILISTEVRGMPLNNAVRGALSQGDRGAWDEYSPRGKVDLTINLSKDKDSAVEPKLYIEATGTGESSVEYQGFKYRLDNLRGSFVIDGKDVFIRNVTSQNGTRTVKIDGQIRQSGKVNVTIEGTDIGIDEKLLWALSEDQRNSIDSFRLSGATDLLVKVARQNKSESVGVTVEIIPNGKTCARPREFPVPIDKISGRIILEPDSNVLLRSVRGNIGAGEIAFSDTAFQRSETSELNIRCSLKSILIDETLLSAVSSAAKTNLSFIQLSGLADAELSLWRPEGGKNLNLFCAVTLKDASLTYKEIPIPATDINGYLEITQDGLRIRSLRGKCQTGTALIWGEILTGAKKNAIRLNIEAHRVALNAQLRNSLPAELRQIYDSFSPSGRATVSVRVTGDLSKLEPQIRLTLENCSLKHTSFPYRVTGVDGSVKINPAANEVAMELTAAEPQFRLRGKSTKTDSGQETELRIESDELSISPELREALPQGVQEVIKALSLKGLFGVSLTLAISEKVGQEQHIRYTAELMPKKCSFFAGLPFSEVSGNLRLEGEVLPGGEHKLNLGRLQFSDFTVANRRVQWMSAKIVLEGDRIKIASISGKIAGGTLQGEISAAVTGKPDYSGNLSVTDANIRDAAEDIFGKKIENASGYASAWLNFRGESAELSDFKATGGVRFRKANLVEVPVISDIIQYFRGASVNFENGKAQFDIEKGHFYFNELKLKSTVCNLNGVGRMRFDGKLNLIFSLEWLSKVLPPGLRQAWQAFQNNLFQLSVTGDLHSVSVREVSFEPLGNALKKLITEEDKDRK
jgi:hypothetical protein